MLKLLNHIQMNAKKEEKHFLVDGTFSIVFLSLNTKYVFTVLVHSVSEKFLSLTLMRSCIFYRSLIHYLDISI